MMGYTRRVQVSVVVMTVLAAVFLFACQRSAGYRKDQDYFKSEPEGYYNKTPQQGKGSVARRIESMGQPKKRIVILSFWNDTPVNYGDLGNFAADELKRAVSQTQRLIVPPEIKPTQGTADFVQGDSVRVAQLIREGRKLGVAALVIGRISKAVFRQRGDEVGLFRQRQSLAAVEVEIKLFDVVGGREILAIGKAGESSSNTLVALESSNQESQEFRSELLKLALRNAVASLVPPVVQGVEKMTWQGHIAKITGNKIYVSAGRASGLISGDILKVMTVGEEIYDPVTGAYLGRAQGQLKGTVEVVDFIGLDGAVAVIHAGGNFQEGDPVQLY